VHHRFFFPFFFMDDSQPPLDLAGPTDGDTTLTLADYAQTAYLEYALSVVKGRALPDVSDGQKPVQRRILYSMSRMGLGFGGTNGTVGAKPVKSARVVGDVLGRFHPHSDQAAYDALVRMAQDFSQRYPLVDGQGNFGSRDGDGAAAMRYTEARLARITSLLLDEIDEGTVDFIPNYDGSTEEPRLLPARLPFTLLNGASGIAVGLATEIPSHNLREIADACVALIKSNGKLSEEELLAIVPGPDYPGGAQIISGASDIADAYRTGRGSLKVRARWKIEDLARGQWQLVVNELPPGVSTQKVLEEIEEITNPKVKAGKKALSADQTQLKAAMLSVLDVVRDESSKDAAVRLVFEPKTSRISQEEFITTLLAQTSLETSSSINLTMVGIDGKPTQKSLRQMLNEWIAFREITVEKRSRHRLNKVLERIHILEGRQLVLLNIDEVIAIIRAAEDPKAALIARFNLSERQAEDILEIRLRQLARLEAIKIEQELKGLREEQKKLEDILGSPATLRRLLIKEIESDAKTFEDPRRTLIQAEKRAVAEVKVVDEPVTVIVSQKGWVRAQKGWASEKAANGSNGSSTPEYSFKSGDALYGAFECRSVDTLLVFGSSKDKSVRVYTVPVASLPWRARRRAARHHAHRAGRRHARHALLRGPGGRERAAGQHRRLRLHRDGGEHDVAPARRQGLHRRGRGRTALPSFAGGRRERRRADAGRHACGLRLDGRPHPHLRHRRAQEPAQGRPRPHADRPGAQGHPRGCRGLHAQREDRRHRPRRQGARRDAGDPHPQQRARHPCAQGQGGRPGLQAGQHRAGAVMGGIDISVIGLFIAVVTGLASFLVGRHFRMKRAAKRREKDRAAAQAIETRQVRRARERREGGK
jgi:topoisomerase-4 subunit A